MEERKWLIEHINNTREQDRRMYSIHKLVTGMSNSKK